MHILKVYSYSKVANMYVASYNLIDFPEAGVRDALVVPIEENKQVYNSYCSLSY